MRSPTWPSPEPRAQGVPPPAGPRLPTRRRTRPRALSTLDPERLLTASPQPGDHPVAFLFPGRGRSARGHGTRPLRRRAFLPRGRRPMLPAAGAHPGFDLREALFADPNEPSVAERLQADPPGAAGPVRRLSWATARLWMRWGRPEAMLGHSIGQATLAACLAGVLAGGCPDGRGPARPADGRDAAGGHAPAFAAGSRGPPLLGGEAVAHRRQPPGGVGRRGRSRRSRSWLPARGAGTPLPPPPHTSRTPSLRDAWSRCAPFAGGSGRGSRRLACRSSERHRHLIRAEEATDPEYWARQVRQPVPLRRRRGPPPGRADPHPAGGRPGEAPSRPWPASIRRPARARHDRVAPPPQQADGDTAFPDAALAPSGWPAARVDWTAYWAGERRQRVALPSTPSSAALLGRSRCPRGRAPRKPAGGQRSRRLVLRPGLEAVGAAGLAGSAATAPADRFAGELASSSTAAAWARPWRSAWKRVAGASPGWPRALPSRTGRRASPSHRGARRTTRRCSTH